MVIQNKVTNASSDRELILIWLGGKSETTQISYNSTVNKFIEFIGKPLSDVKLEDLQLWERHWSQVKEIRKKSREIRNRVKLIRGSQSSDSVYP